MLTTVAGVVGLRATVTPRPHDALASSGLVTEAGPNVATTPSPTPAPVATGGTAQGKKVIVGEAYDVSYGVVQVKVTMTGPRITDISTLSLPQGGRSGDISQFAEPQLRSEALAAQSAHIDSVSGASYTSAGYAMSLQSALDRSGS
ncbi:FMN-binding protein [Nocardioides jensenii]|uniref:FMN-binding protein n=1 Tax=Nocardioides jensenii TaxID=1843 RepID=UPI0014702A4E|nr:FMN-binding protein [Nocardioides jensenii]